MSVPSAPQKPPQGKRERRREYHAANRAAKLEKLRLKPAARAQDEKRLSGQQAGVEQAAGRGEEAHISAAVLAEPRAPAGSPGAASADLPVVSAPASEPGRRSVMIPFRRVPPLREHWAEICGPIVREAKLDIRFDPQTRCVELRANARTTAPEALDRAADFLRAFALGFEYQDAMAFLRMDDLYLDSFDLTNVKLSLKGDNMSRAVGRIAGIGGKVKFTIENATKTRIVLADKTVHILGTPTCTRVARTAVCDLILGAPPAKVYQRLRAAATRLSATG